MRSKKPSRAEPRGPQHLSGLHPVAEALAAARRPLHKLRIRAGRHGPAVLEMVARAEALGVPVEEDAPEHLEALAGGGNPQGVVLEAGPLPWLSLEALMDSDRPDLRLVALDGVEDPQNVGSIARVADAAGVSGLILTSRRAPPLGPAVSRASAGAIEHLPVARVPNLGQAINVLKRNDFWTFGADPSATTDLFALPDRILSGRALIVLAAEGRGLRPGVRDRLDHLVRIPMRGRVDSLNVAAAAAVMLFDWVRRFDAGAARDSRGG